MTHAYYNEIDHYCADWLRNLITEGLIAPGDVDERDIRDVRPSDLDGYAQCHFFAGIGGWSLALRLAGWPDDRPVWTGSCPCQPFSAAGKRQGGRDERHLWPAFYRLIAQCAASMVFGEQVASKLGRAWLAAVRSDLEALGYAVGAADLCAASVGAPHIRQRLWFVANSLGERLEIDRQQSARHQCETAERSGKAGELADAERNPGDARRLASKSGEGSGAPQKWAPTESGRCSLSRPWSDLIWLPCTDGKQRPTGRVVYAEGGQVGFPRCAWQQGEAAGQGTVESIIQPLAHGIPARVDKLRAAGNAICPQVAAEFIRASEDALRCIMARERIEKDASLLASVEEVRPFNLDPKA